MKRYKRQVMGLSLLCLAACGDSAITTVGNPSDPTNTNTVTDGTETIKQIPALDPNAVDSTTGASLSALELEFYDDSILSVESDSGSSSSLDILITQEAAIDDNQSGGIELFQCNGGSQGKYVSVVADQSSDDVVQYTVRMISEGDFDGDIDLSFVGDTDGSGTLTGDRTLSLNALKDSVNYSIALTSSDTLNQFVANDGTNSIQCVWDSDQNGCAKIGSSDAVPFSFSLDSDGQRTYESAEDTLCDQLPSAIAAVTAPESFSDSRSYDCGVRSGCTEVNPVSAISLEDAGGDQCADLSNHWSSASTDPSACDDSSSATGVGCYCDSMYALATQMIKNSTRSGLCKVMGMANNGDIELGARTEDKSVCVQDLTIGSNE